MSGEWKTWHEPDGLWTVLMHPSGAKAYFSSFRIGEVIMRHGRPHLENPFEQLAWLIGRGLRPSKVEGDASVFVQRPEFAIVQTLALEDRR